MGMEAMVAHDPWTLTLTNPMGWRVMEVEAEEEVVVVVTGKIILQLSQESIKSNLSLNHSSNLSVPEACCYDFV